MFKTMLMFATLTVTTSALAQDMTTCPMKLARVSADLKAARTAMARANREMDIDRHNVAQELVTAAAEQERAIKRECSAKVRKNVAKADPFENEKTPAPVVIVPPPWQEPIPVPGLPYLVDEAVEANCPGPSCPVVWTGTGETYKSPEKW